MKNCWCFEFFEILILIKAGHYAIATSTTYPSASIEYIQNYNVKTLKNALQLGWKQFCEADVDEAVMSFFPGSNPSDATLHFVTPNNETVSLPIKYLTKVADFGLNPRLRTIVYVNAFLTDHIYDVRGSLQYMQETRKDCNIIVVDVAHGILQLYNAIKNNVFVHGYYISKLISTLTDHGVKQSNITLVGHSVGANIAALGASLYSQEQNGQKVSTLIAIDPAAMCQTEDVFVNRNVTERVIVIHGENDVFSIGEPIGTVDIYPNGNGLKYQPGCSTKLCSHVFPFHLFLDAVVEGTVINAVKCESWSSFRRGKCDYSSVLTLGFNFDRTVNGKYFCLTEASQPYGLKDESLKLKHRKLRPLTANSTEPVRAGKII